MKTVNVYSPDELKEVNPRGFERALERWRGQNDEIPWSDEIIGSLKAIFEASNIALRDYEISAFSYSHVSFDMGTDVKGLSGNRALAWLENNLLADLRIPFTGEKRWDLSKYGQGYRAGMIKPCPFTGYCADDDFIESLIEDIKAGETISEAYHSLAQKAGKMFESEAEYQNSEENFLEQEHLEFTIDGRMV